mgnify:CR=1 FL=1
MQKRLIVNHELLEIMVMRLCHQLIEGHQDFANSVILGLQPRGIHVAERIQRTLVAITGKTIPTGYLDTTFHRDDFRRRESPLTANATSIDFVIEDKNVILVDDVLYSGRTVRAALDAITDFGRPRQVKLAVLVDRGHRELPIRPDFVGKNLPTAKTERVRVLLNQTDGQDQVVIG